MTDTRKRENTIAVNLDDLEQSFNTMDPSPFHEKDLDHDLEEFIVSWATEYPLQEPVPLVVHLQNRPSGIYAQSVIEKAVPNYFRYRTDLNQRELKLLLREGRTSLVIGLSFLTVCMSGQMATRFQIPDASVVEASLTIAGWVARWHPMDVFLYGWWPLRREGSLSQAQRHPGGSQILRGRKHCRQIPDSFRGLTINAVCV